jgi:hypothetical protein
LVTGAEEILGGFRETMRELIEKTLEAINSLIERLRGPQPEPVRVESKPGSRPRR